MKIYSERNQIRIAIAQIKQENRSIGFVPTMGALHQGHITLVRQALANNDVVVVSIFVNPTQFDKSDDLDKYPRTLESDAALLQEVSNDILIYAPSVDDVYGGNAIAEHFSFDGLEHEMEGKFRDGHFDGVGTIVKRLFEIVTPDNAYFGEKDFQQLMIIKKLVEKYRIPVNVVGCEIHREASGLAMSSRNVRLKSEHKMAAPFIYETLKSVKTKFGTESANYLTNWVKDQFAMHDLLELEYFIIADVDSLKTVNQKINNKKYRAFIAVYADDVRLIDNIALN